MQTSRQSLGGAYSRPITSAKVRSSALIRNHEPCIGYNIMDAWKHACVYVCKSVSIYVCMYACVCACMCVRVCLCIIIGIRIAQTQIKIITVTE